MCYKVEKDFLLSLKTAIYGECVFSLIISKYIIMLYNSCILFLTTWIVCLAKKHKLISLKLRGTFSNILFWQLSKCKHVKFTEMNTQLILHFVKLKLFPSSFPSHFRNSFVENMNLVHSHFQTRLAHVARKRSLSLIRIFWNEQNKQNKSSGAKAK